MNRRTFYIWLVRAMGAAVALVVVVPGVRYLFDPLHRKSTKTKLFQRVVRLDELVAGVHRQAVVSGTRKDAWTVHQQEVLGRIWLMRKPDDGTPPAEGDATNKVEAYTSICPHLGCEVTLNAEADQYICPCHHAGFHLTGTRLTEEELGEKNASPRDLDTVPCRLVLDKKTEEWWVEVQYQKFRTGVEVKAQDV